MKIRDTNLELYLEDIRKYPLLTEEEEKYYFAKLKEGCLEARQKIITSNLRLVVHEAKKYYYPSISFLDIIQEGNLGLFKAINRFDLNKGKFSTYAVPWINQAINEGLSYRLGKIKIPVYVHKELSSYKKIYKSLKENSSHEPTDEEIAKVMNINTEFVSILRNLNQEAISLNNFISQEDDTEFITFLESSEPNPEDNTVMSDLAQKISELLESSGLRENEKEVLKLRFGLGCYPHSQQETANIFSLTYQRIQQIERNALQKIRNNSKIKQFTVYMDNPEQATNAILEYKKEKFNK